MKLVRLILEVAESNLPILTAGIFFEEGDSVQLVEIEEGVYALRTDANPARMASSLEPRWDLDADD